MRLGIPIPTRHGWGLLLGVIPLCLVGVLSIQATSASDQAGLVSSDAVRQVVFIGVGLAGMLVMLAVGYQRLGRFSYVLFAAGIALLLCLIVDRWIDLPFVPVRRNARRESCHRDHYSGA